MIDIHAHILPGIDDGAGDIYDTLEMARIAAESGVHTIVATPHCNIPGVFNNYFGDAYVDLFRNTEKAIKNEGIDVQLCPGMEVFATADLPQLLTDGKIMTLNQSRYLLVEFSFDEDPGFVMHILDKIVETGVKPVIAHAERYEFVQDDPSIAWLMRNREYAIQINKGSILGKFGRRAWDAAWKLLDHNLVSAVASDAHSPFQRTPYLRNAYEELENEVSDVYRTALFEQNPANICNDKPVTHQKAIPFEDNY